MKKIMNVFKIFIDSVIEGRKRKAEFFIKNRMYL
jgi:hypothetical protein